MPVSRLTLPEEMLLLGWNDEQGRNRSTYNLSMLLAGASVLELVLRDAVTVSGDHLHATSAQLDDPVLDRVLDEIRSSNRPRSVKGWVARIGQRRWLRPMVVNHLVEQGILRHETKSVLGLITWSSYPVVDRSAVTELRDRPLHVLTRPEPVADVSDAALGGLVHSGGGTLLRQLVPGEQRADARKRAKALSKGEGISADVAKAIGDANVATMAAITAAAAAAAAGGAAGS
jgi:golgi phosphoprotein 3